MAKIQSNASAHAFFVNVVFEQIATSKNFLWINFRNNDHLGQEPPSKNLKTGDFIPGVSPVRIDRLEEEINRQAAVLDGYESIEIRQIPERKNLFNIVVKGALASQVERSPTTYLKNIRTLQNIFRRHVGSSYHILVCKYSENNEKGLPILALSVGPYSGELSSGNGLESVLIDIYHCTNVDLIPAPEIDELLQDGKIALAPPSTTIIMRINDIFADFLENIYGGIQVKTAMKRSLKEVAIRKLVLNFLLSITLLFSTLFIAISRKLSNIEIGQGTNIVLLLSLVFLYFSAREAEKIRKSP